MKPNMSDVDYLKVALEQKLETTLNTKHYPLFVMVY